MRQRGQKIGFLCDRWRVLEGVISVTDDFRVDSSQTDLERLHHAERILHVHREDVLVHLQKEKQNKVKAGKAKSAKDTRALQPRNRQANAMCCLRIEPFRIGDGPCCPVSAAACPRDC